MRIIDLSKHELVLATGIGARHGISGHTFELLEYWWYFRQHNVDVAIMCTAHKPEVLTALACERYCFTEAELDDLANCCYDATAALLASLPVVIWVDGCSKYVPHAAVVAKRQIAFACNNSEEFHSMDIVLGDTRLYDDTVRGHYVKKLLFSKFRAFACSDEAHDTAMLYCTIQARKLPQDYIDALPERFPQFKKFLLVTNDNIQSHDCIEVVQHPCKDLFTRFGTYIYSPLKIGWKDAIDRVVDCSPRFPAECTWYKKEIILDAPISRGLQARLYDCEDLEKIELTKNDNLINLVF